MTYDNLALLNAFKTNLEIKRKNALKLLADLHCLRDTPVIVNEALDAPLVSAARKTLLDVSCILTDIEEDPVGWGLYLQSMKKAV